MAGATAGSVTLAGLTPVILYEGACTDFTIWDDGPVPAMILVEGMHVEGEEFEMPVGTIQRFRIKNMGIKRVSGHTFGPPSVIRWAVTGKTARED